MKIYELNDKDTCWRTREEVDNKRRSKEQINNAFSLFYKWKVTLFIIKATRFIIASR